MSKLHEMVGHLIGLVSGYNIQTVILGTAKRDYSPFPLKVKWLRSAKEPSKSPTDDLV